MTAIQLICDRCGRRSTQVYTSRTDGAGGLEDAISRARAASWYRGRDGGGDTSADLCPTCADDRRRASR